MVSIIVPVYNGEAYLDRCMESIVRQTYKNIEILLINDGSTDGTAGLCDSWAGRDSRVRVIHQQNAGVSAARNTGLEAAGGKYIGFVDADDTISEDTYRVAVAAMDSCDMVMWDAVTLWQDGKQETDTIPQLEEDRVLTRQDWSPALLRWMAGSVWRCLYRAEQLKDVRFPVGIKLSEDRLFNLQAMGKARTLRYVKKGMYFRVIRPGSACNRYHGDLFEKNLQANDLAMQIIDQYWSGDYRPIYTRMFVIGGALDMIRQICSRQFPEKRRTAVIRTIANNKEVREAFGQYPPQSLQEKLLYMRQIPGLWIIGHIQNMRK